MNFSVIIYQLFRSFFFIHHIFVYFVFQNLAIVSPVYLIYIKLFVYSLLHICERVRAIDSCARDSWAHHWKIYTFDTQGISWNMHIHRCISIFLRIDTWNKDKACSRIQDNFSLFSSSQCSRDQYPYNHLFKKCVNWVKST